jgi:hypothetical protein
MDQCAFYFETFLAVKPWIRLVSLPLHYSRGFEVDSCALRLHPNHRRFVYFSLSNPCGVSTNVGKGTTIKESVNGGVLQVSWAAFNVNKVVAEWLDFSWPRD